MGFFKQRLFNYTSDQSSFKCTHSKFKLNPGFFSHFVNRDFGYVCAFFFYQMFQFQMILFSIPARTRFPFFLFYVVFFIPGWVTAMVCLFIKWKFNESTLLFFRRWMFIYEPDKSIFNYGNAYEIRMREKLKLE